MTLTKAVPGLTTLEVLVDEAVEASHKLDHLSLKLRRLKKGSPAYFDLLSEISVAATVLGAKAGSLERMIDDLIEVMPSE